MLVFHSASEHQRYKECHLELIVDQYTHPTIKQHGLWINDKREREREGEAVMAYTDISRETLYAVRINTRPLEERERVHEIEMIYNVN